MCPKGSGQSSYLSTRFNFQEWPLLISSEVRRVANTIYHFTKHLYWICHNIGQSFSFP